MGKYKSGNGVFQRFMHGIMAHYKVGQSDLAKLFSYVVTPRKRKVILRNVYQFSKAFYSRITSEGVLKESASLTFITLLSFVPFITFLMLIAPDLPFLNLEEKFGALVAKNFIPGSANAIMNFVNDLITKRVGFNIVSFAVLIVTSYSLFKVIRDTFDRILNVQQKVSHDFLTQFVKFFGTIVFGLLIIVMLFSSSSIPLVSKLLKLPILRWLLVVVPFVVQFLALLFLYMLLPSVRVRRSSLIRGAFWTTVIWVMAKSLFDVYIYNLTNMQAIYGVMAALPIFLTWIYVNWIIILSGIALVSVIDSHGQEDRMKNIPQKSVRITIDMFTDKKLAQHFESIMSKKEIKKLAEKIGEEEET